MARDVQTEPDHAVTLRFRANSAQRRVTDAIVVVVLLGGLIGWAIGFAPAFSGTLAVVSAAYLLFQWLPPVRRVWPVLSRGPGVRPHLAEDTVVILDAKGVHRNIGQIQR
ncbi:MAG: hypothetical protein ACRDGB_06630, partial [Candidatus Limnocylindria bacterium]